MQSVLLLFVILDDDVDGLVVRLDLFVLDEDCLINILVVISNINIYTIKIYIYIYIKNILHRSSYKSIYNVCTMIIYIYSIYIYNYIHRQRERERETIYIYLDLSICFSYYNICHSSQL